MRISWLPVVWMKPEAIMLEEFQARTGLEGAVSAA